MKPLSRKTDDLIGTYRTFGEPRPVYVRPTTHRVQVTLTSEGQITIPPDVWEAFVEGWKDPWAGLTMNEVMDELRGPVALPPDMVP